MNAPVPPAESAIRVENLGLQIGGATILKDVALDVAAGSFVGVIGPNGAGKTTLFNVISGLVKPTAGRVLMHGKDITSMSVPARARAASGSHGRTSGKRADRAVEIAHEKLRTVGLDHKAAALAGDISHGDKRKLEIAVILATQADIVLLDEPMAGVASGDVAGLVDNIRTMQADKGCTVLMVEHHLEVLLGLVEKVAVMYFGSIIAYDTPQKVMADPVVQQAYLGSAA